MALNKCLSRTNERKSCWNCLAFTTVNEWKNDIESTLHAHVSDLSQNEFYAILFLHQNQNKTAYFMLHEFIQAKLNLKDEK